MLKSGPMDEIIEVEGLVKRYGPLKAIDNISLTVHPGEIFGAHGRRMGDDDVLCADDLDRRRRRGVRFFLGID